MIDAQTYQGHRRHGPKATARPLTPIDIRSSPTFRDTRVAVVTPETDERGDPIGWPIDPRANQITAREIAISAGKKGREKISKKL
ncbi:hypothetical protein RRG08_028878 [Elysia crispata]|uniref:Uncharacterized protein n=1 Tax=Elysia crispata TaxID=231223 RepID=A0AAE0Z081_9GAST|nr:hypothetical protein RRG08_028878 [Elysia crispata]